MYINVIILIIIMAALWKTEKDKPRSRRIIKDNAVVQQRTPDATTRLYEGGMK